MKKNKEQPPPSRIPSTEELRKFAGQTIRLLNKCIAQFEPAKQLKDQIMLGLLTKEFKTYRNVFKIADQGDSDTPPILARVIYELALSIVYLLLNEDENPNLYDEFKKTALQRAYQSIGEMEHSKYSDRNSTKKTILSIKQKLSDEGFQVEESSENFPKSWHSNLSYYQMAEAVGEEFLTFYTGFYGTSSIFVHPSWLDLEQNHIITTQKGTKSRIISPTLSVYPLCTVTCLLLISSEICAMKLSEKNRTKNVRLVNKIRRVHHLFHNGSPEPPFYDY